jgi:hypothetical protein
MLFGQTSVTVCFTVSVPKQENRVLGDGHCPKKEMFK